MDEDQVVGQDSGQDSGQDQTAVQQQVQNDVQLPFGVAQNRRLDLLQTGLGQVETDMGNGVLDRPTGQGLIGRLMAEISPLTQRKLQTEQQGRQRLQDQQAQDFQNTQAHTQSLGQANAQHNAQNFDNTTAVHINPQTGDATSFYQESPGKWKPVPDKKTADQTTSQAAAPVIPASQAGTSADPYRNTAASANPLAGVGSADGGPGPTQGASDDASQERPPDVPDEQTERPPDASPAGPQPTNGPPLTADQIAAGGRVLPDGTVSYAPGAVAGATAMNDLRNGVRGGEGVGAPPPGANQPPVQGDRFYQQAVANAPPQPTQFIRGPHGQPVETGAYKAWFAGVMRSAGQGRAAASAQVEEDYRDGLKNHPLKNYQDSAQPNRARMNDIMSDFALNHPDDPRVKSWQGQEANNKAALAAKDPATMSLAELASAALGPHVNLAAKGGLLEQAEAEVKADDRVIPLDTDRGGITYNPSDGSKDGVYKNMRPEGIHDEANRRVRGQLINALGSKQPPPSQPQQQPNTASQPNAAQPKLPAAPQSADEARRNLDAINKIQKQRAAAKAKADAEKPAFDEQGHQVGQWLEGGFGSF